MVVVLIDDYAVTDSLCNLPSPVSSSQNTRKRAHCVVFNAGANPPYFSTTVSPISSLQEPALQSTKAIQKQLAAIDTVNFRQGDPDSTNTAAYTETLRSRNKLLNYGAQSSRYKGLVPIDVAIPPPPKRISKQVDPEWRREVRSENKPRVDDIPLPEYKLPSSTQMPLSDPARQQRASWAKNKGKFRAASVRSRYRAYYP